MPAAAVAEKRFSLLNDIELVALALGGRHDEFEELVRRYQKQITGYVARIVGDHESALDVTQEVFIKVYNSLHRYRSEYKFSTWLYRIAHNAAVDHLRRNPINIQSIETENAEGTYQLQFESPCRSPEQERTLKEWRVELGKVVGLLPDSYKQLILLRHAYEMSYDEIAEIAGLPLGTVKNRLFRAREMMRNIMIERGFDGI